MIGLGVDTAGNGSPFATRWRRLSATATRARRRGEARSATPRAISRRDTAVRLEGGRDRQTARDSEQQAAIRRMRKLKDQGLALRTIADIMTEAGVRIRVEPRTLECQSRPVRGGHWTMHIRWLG
jgi:hypothetical protein